MLKLFMYLISKFVVSADKRGGMKKGYAIVEISASP